MSLFKGERVYPLAVLFQPRSAPINYNDGEMYYDIAQKALVYQFNGMNTANQAIAGVNVTPVTSTNPSATSTLMSLNVAANTLSVVGKTIHVYAAGIYNVQGTPTLTFNVNFGATGMLSFVSGATTNAAVNTPWSIDAWITTQAAGATGAVEAHGRASITLGGTNTAATSTYLDSNIANVSSMNLTAASNVNISVLSSTSNVNTVVVQRYMSVELGN